MPATAPGPTCIVQPDGLQVTVQGAPPTVVSWRWVRDHGEDPVSFNLQTRQRRVNVLQSRSVAAATSATNATVDGMSVLQLEWPDEPITTWISFDTLTRLVAPTTAATEQTSVVHWSSPAAIELTETSVDQALTNDDALRVWLGDIRQYGVGRLTGFDGSESQAEALARRVGYPRASIFGTMWELAADVTTHDDTAYTYDFLAPHTDGTYSHDAPGLQMFACVERDGPGGESVVVDAYAIAEHLRTIRPDLFETLATVGVPAHYIEPGIELRAERPVLRLDDAGAVAQVSVNTYDRSPMLLPGDQMDRFYEAYGEFDRLANEPGRWMKIRLAAGDVLAIDNWRCLHGRMAYSGARRFVGCYLNYEDLESRWRVLGLA